MVLFLKTTSFDLAIDPVQASAAASTTVACRRLGQSGLRNLFWRSIALFNVNGLNRYPVFRNRPTLHTGLLALFPLSPQALKTDSRNLSYYVFGGMKEH